MLVLEAQYSGDPNQDPVALMIIEGGHVHGQEVGGDLGRDMKIIEVGVVVLVLAVVVVTQEVVTGGGHVLYLVVGDVQDQEVDKRLQKDALALIVLVIDIHVICMKVREVAIVEML